MSLFNLRNYFKHIILIILCLYASQKGYGQRIYANGTTYSPNGLGVSVVAPNAAKDGDENTGSSIRLTTLALLGSAWQNLSFSTPLKPYSPIYLILRANTNNILNLLEKISIEATDINANPVGAVNGGNFPVAQLNGNSGKQEIFFKPTTEFYGVKVSITAPLTLGNQDVELFEAFHIAPPSIKDVTVCAGNKAVIKVAPELSGKYHLYTSQIGGTRVDTDSHGEFEVGPVSSTTTYYVEAEDTQGSENHFSARVPVTVHVSTAAGITLGANPEICSLASVATLPYINVSGSPTTYNIVWNATALSLGFNNVSNTALPGSQININTPPTAPAGTYSGSLTVRNSCGNSTPVTFSVVIQPKPKAPNVQFSSN